MQEQPIKLYSSTRKTREILYSAPTNGKSTRFRTTQLLGRFRTQRHEETRLTYNPGSL